MLGLGWPTLQHQKGPEPSSSLHRESPKAAAGEDNHWRSSYRQAVGRKRKKLQREERPGEARGSAATHAPAFGHLVTTREHWALPAEGNEPDHTGVTTKTDCGTVAEDWERPYRQADQGLVSPRGRQWCHYVSDAKRASLLAELSHREHLRYSARQSEELRCLLSHDKRERIPSPTHEMTMEQSTCRVTDERRYARH
jgi:hypothetical protein